LSIEKAKQLIKQKENIRLEFKEAKNALPGNLFETICAMLNREGGDIFLGVSDAGKLLGVDEPAIEAIITNLVNLSNNPQKLDPPFILFPLKYQIGDKWVIQIQVPASSQLHKTAGQVYDRSNDGDFKVTQPHLIAEIYNRKRNHYTEGIIYPALRFEDLRQDLFSKIRNLIRSNSASHPWLALSDTELLQKAGLWKRDFQTGQEGYTLGAVLLFAKDEVIQQILPHYKIDVLVRIENLDRYDDREYIQTNLVDAYEKLMNFVGKHLPDKFYLEGDQRVSLRTKIFREVVANLLVHREYTNASPCTFIIYNDRVETRNANNPHGDGPINPNTFAPFPKNPSIAKFFIQLGWVDELGSGVLNVNKFVTEYGGKGTPDFIEGNTFQMRIPVPVERVAEGVIEGVDSKVEGVIEGVTEGVSDEVREKLKRIFLVIYKNGGVRAIHIEESVKLPGKSVERYIKMLKDADLIEFKGAPKTGGYYLTTKAAKKIK
jgi:ATP-dependent DNA helicase RecG